MTSQEDSDYYQNWQKDVAEALRTENQPRLDRLFSKRPASVEENYIFKVYVNDANEMTHRFDAPGCDVSTSTYYVLKDEHHYSTTITSSYHPNN